MAGLEIKAAVPVFLLTTFLKILLVPSYHSTDFEVHRNWLAITHSVPHDQWYHESTSEWTLDYPPFFALFEWFLSQFASLFDEDMLIVSNLGHNSERTILFQRLTVIVSDLVLFYAIFSYCSDLPNRPDYGSPLSEFMPDSKRMYVLLLTLSNPGLLLVDHVHFQYNGFLFGILILSLKYISEGHDLLGGVLFAILLNFKHIFLYVAPLYFVYLLRNYCFLNASIRYVGWEQFESNAKQTKRKFSWLNFLKLSSAVIFVFALSFGPHLRFGFANFMQIFRRMFPFTDRGLTHAYWAPNVWALYNFFDMVCSRLFLRSSQRGMTGTTRGLVRNATHVLLPSIRPLYTIVLTLLAMSPVIISVFRRPHRSTFLSAFLYCTMCSFMLGWHVHEKAILMVSVPLFLHALTTSRATRLCIFTSIVGTFSLFPLFQETKETPTKILILATHIALCHLVVQEARRPISRSKGWLTRMQLIYCCGLLFLQAFTSIIQPMAPSLRRLEFLPLMLTSVYCTLGLMYTWVELYAQYFNRIRMLDTNSDN